MHYKGLCFCSVKLLCRTSVSFQEAFIFPCSVPLPVPFDHRCRIPKRLAGLSRPRPAWSSCRTAARPATTARRTFPGNPCGSPKPGACPPRLCPVVRSSGKIRPPNRVVLFTYATKYLKTKKKNSVPIICSYLCSSLEIFPLLLYLLL